MPLIVIAGTPIQFPDTKASPDWSESVIQFAEAVESALSSVVGSFDVAPQSFVIDAYNPGSGIDIPNLAFSTTSVRSAFIRYTVYRNTSTTTVTEAGTITIVYNPTNPVGNKWEIIQERAGDASISISISDTGQFSLTTSTLSGLNHVGKVSYQAQALAQ